MFLLPGLCPTSSLGCATKQKNIQMRNEQTSDPLHKKGSSSGNYYHFQDNIPSYNDSQNFDPITMDGIRTPQENINVPNPDKLNDSRPDENRSPDASLHSYVGFSQPNNDL